MKITLLILTVVFSTVRGQGEADAALCLPQLNVESNIKVNGRTDASLQLCENLDFDTFLKNEIQLNYNSSDIMGGNCRIEGLTQITCNQRDSKIAKGKISILFHTNLTCNNGCTQLTTTRRENIEMYIAEETTLRRALRRTKRIRVSYNGAGDEIKLRILYFRGKRNSIFGTCRNPWVNDVMTGRLSRGKEELTLCTCPEDCQTCSGGKTFDRCGTACPTTCENRDEQIICTRLCVEGCFCPMGMVEHEGNCISDQDCPDEEEEVDKTPSNDCLGGKELMECGSACPPTCDNPSPICTFQCVKGCFCPVGMVEHEGNCINDQDCPDEEEEVDKTPSNDCLGGKELMECGSACPPTCDNPSPICTFQCVKGCFCPMGMVEHDGKCINDQDCPDEEEEVDKTPSNDCLGDKELMECGSACPPTCDNPSPICTFQCVKGCFCPVGMVENEGNCINDQDCPDEEEEVDKTPSNDCLGGKELMECGSPCPPTCDNPSPICTFLYCVKGCFCPADMVEHEERCIPLEDCPTNDDPETLGRNKRLVLNNTRDDDKQKKKNDTDESTYGNGKIDSSKNGDKKKDGDLEENHSDNGEVDPSGNKKGFEDQNPKNDTECDDSEEEKCTDEKEDKDKDEESTEDKDKDEEPTVEEEDKDKDEEPTVEEEDKDKDEEPTVEEEDKDKNEEPTVEEEEEDKDKDEESTVEEEDKDKDEEPTVEEEEEDKDKDEESTVEEEDKDKDEESTVEEEEEDKDEDEESIVEEEDKDKATVEGKE